MIQVGHKINDFECDAYHDGEIKKSVYHFTKANGWSCYFIRRISPLFVRRSSRMRRTITKNSKRPGQKFSA